MELWSNRVNTLSQQNIITAFDIGLRVPEISVLKNKPDEEINKIVNSYEWDCPFEDMAVKKIDGIKLSIFAWMGDEGYKYKTCGFLDNHLLSGCQGPMLDANIVTIFPSEFPLADKHFKKLFDITKRKEESFKGFVGMTLTLNERKGFKKEVYYNRVHFGVSYDFFYAFAELYGMKPEGLKDNLIENKPLPEPSKYAGAMRVYSYPYDKVNNFDLHVNGHPGEDCYIVTSWGKTISETWNKIFKKVKDKRACYRIDGASLAKTAFNDLKRKRFI